MVKAHGLAHNNSFSITKVIEKDIEEEGYRQPRAPGQACGPSARDALLRYALAVGVEESAGQGGYR